MDIFKLYPEKFQSVGSFGDIKDLNNGPTAYIISFNYIWLILLSCGMIILSVATIRILKNFEGKPLLMNFVIFYLLPLIYLLKQIIS